MSHDSQRLDIEHLQRKLSGWLRMQPDYDRHRRAIVAKLLRPTLAQLQTDPIRLLSNLDRLPEAAGLCGLIQEEILGGWIDAFPDDGPSYDGPSYIESFLSQAGRHENGLCRRYLRRLSMTVPTTWQVRRIESGANIVIASLDDAETIVVRDRARASSLEEGNVLVTRVVDLPSGHVLSASLMKLTELPEGDWPEAIDRDILYMNIRAMQLLMTPEQVAAAEREAASLGRSNSGDSDGINKGSKARSDSVAGTSDASVRDTGARQGKGGQDNAGHGNAGHGNAGHGNTGHGDPSRPSVRTATPHTDHERVLERVRKLFALAQETDASPHEAEIALRRCQSLMSKYGITEADLETSAFGNAEITTGRTVPMHMKYLASAVSRLHDVLFVSGPQGFAEFRGFEVDANVARLTLDYLLDAVERALAARKRGGDFPAGRSAAYDYRLAFAIEVNRRVKELVEERLREEGKHAGAGQALVLRKREIVERECSTDLSSSTFRGREVRSAQAHAAGAVDGARVSLDRQVSRSDSPSIAPLDA